MMRKTTGQATSNKLWDGGVAAILRASEQSAMYKHLQLISTKYVICKQTI